MSVVCSASTTTSDVLIPFTEKLNTLSPHVDDDAKRITGAHTKSLWSAWVPGLPQFVRITSFGVNFLHVAGFVWPWFHLAHLRCALFAWTELFQLPGQPPQSVHTAGRKYLLQLVHLNRPRVTPHGPFYEICAGQRNTLSNTYDP